MNVLKKYILLSLCVLFMHSCKEYAQLKSSGRRVSSELSLLRSSGKFLQKMGINPATGADTAGLVETPIQQKHLINTYDYLFDWLNGKNTRLRADNMEWDSSSQTYIVVDPTARKLNPNVDVFGWHPYFMGDLWKTYPYELLSIISFFSYAIDPETGSYTNPEQINMWKEIGMVDSAHAHAKKALLTLSCHGAEQTRRWLENSAAWPILADSAASLLKLKEADGIELDFRDVPEASRQNLNRFVRTFRETMEKKYGDRAFFMAISLPPQNNEMIYDVQEIQAFADLLVIRGYDLNEGTAGASHPAVAPLRVEDGQGLSLETVVEQYLKSGIDTGKTILALPLYGAQWKGIREGDNDYYESSFDRKITYREIRQLYKPMDTSYTLQASLDPISMTRYYLLEFADSSNIECWFDDDYTLGKKMNFALSRNLRGVGLWALGYDNGHREFSSLIEQKFTSDTLIISDPIKEIDGYPIKVAAFIQRHSNLLITASVMLVLAFIAALLMAFSDWRVRDSLFNQSFNHFIFILLSTLTLVPLLSFLNFFGGGRGQLIVAFLLGISIGYVVLQIKSALNFKRP
jgi:spore germination protein YaaH